MLRRLKLLGRCWPTLGCPSSTPFRRAAAKPEGLFHRNFQSSNGQARQHRLNRPRAITISTLDPNKLSPTDYVTSLSGAALFKLYFQGQNEYSGIRWCFGNKRFPDESNGFFYFHKDAKHPIVQASLRFRIAKGPSRADFQEGHDLTNRKGTDGWPWSLNILQIIQFHQTLLSQLLEEGLLSQEELRFCQKVMENSGFQKWLSGLTRLPVISHLSEPFVFNLSHYIRMFLLDTDRAELLRFLGPALFSPYRGKCLIQFEPVSYRRTSGGSIYCHVRVLKILSVIDGAGLSSTVAFPQENSLFTHDGEPVKIAVSFRMESSVRTRRFESVSAGNVSTLDASRLQPSDIVDATGVSTCRFQIAGGKSHLRYFNRKNFPSPAKGFLYFHRDPSRPALSGELRFRLTTGPDQKAFEKGYDLTRPEPRSSEPWSIPLLRVVQSKGYQSILSQLLLDGLVSEEDVQRCKEALCSRQTRFWGPDHCFYGIGDTIVLDFLASAPYFYLLTGDSPTIHVCRNVHVTMDSRRISRWQPFISGKCLVRLEETENPDSHEKWFVLRVVKILEPFKCGDPNYDGHLALPIEGAYLHKRGKPIIIKSFDPPVL